MVLLFATRKWEGVGHQEGCELIRKSFVQSNIRNLPFSGEEGEIWTAMQLGWEASVSLVRFIFSPWPWESVLLVPRCRVTVMNRLLLVLAAGKKKNIQISDGLVLVADG